MQLLTSCNEVVKEALVEGLQYVRARVERELCIEQGCAHAKALEEQFHSVALQVVARASESERELELLQGCSMPYIAYTVYCV